MIKSRFSESSRNVFKVSNNSPRLHQKETTIFFRKIVVSFCSLHFYLFTFLSSLKLSFPEKR